METSLRVQAPAKLNFHLRVYGKRADGFHGLRSVFQTVSIADDIVLRSLKAKDTIEIEGDFDCPPEKTTLHRAVLAFREATGERHGVAVEAIKRIPAGAGMGGGSSDAAALIRALDALSGTRLSTAEMADIGARVGSDVPFFLHGPAAIVEGRGELVEPVSPRPDLVLVAAWPGIPVSTPWAFVLLDERRPDDSTEADPGRDELLARWGGPAALWPFRNSFQEPVAEAVPAVGFLLRRMRELGADFVSMSGSGSTVFGVFTAMAGAETALAALTEDRLAKRLPVGSQAWLGRALARTPRLG